MIHCSKLFNNSVRVNRHLNSHSNLSLLTSFNKWLFVICYIFHVQNIQITQTILKEFWVVWFYIRNSSKYCGEKRFVLLFSNTPSIWSANKESWYVFPSWCFDSTSNVGRLKIMGTEILWSLFHYSFAQGLSLSLESGWSWVRLKHWVPFLCVPVLQMNICKSFGTFLSHFSFGKKNQKQ